MQISRGERDQRCPQVVRGRRGHLRLRSASSQVLKFRCANYLQRAVQTLSSRHTPTSASARPLPALLKRARAGGGSLRIGQRGGEEAVALRVVGAYFGRHLLQCAIIPSGFQIGGRRNGVGQAGRGAFRYLLDLTSALSMGHMLAGL